MITHMRTYTFSASINGLQLDTVFNEGNAKRRAQRLSEFGKIDPIGIGLGNAYVVLDPNTLPEEVKTKGITGTKKEKKEKMLKALQDWIAKQEVLYFYNGNELIAEYNNKNEKLTMHQ